MKFLLELLAKTCRFTGSRYTLWTIVPNQGTLSLAWEVAVTKLLVVPETAVRLEGLVGEG